MTSHTDSPVDARARVAIDLGAESCRVSLLRWRDGRPSIELIHRVPNGPWRHGSCLKWPLNSILAGLEEGLRKAAETAPEGVASIAVDGWAVDYVRLDEQGKPLADPFCYRDERTVASKAAADKIASLAHLYKLTGAQPLRINTLYQLLADASAGIDTAAPWVCLPEYVLCWLGGRRVAEYTNATHTGLVDLRTEDWSRDLFRLLGIPIEAAPPIVRAGTVVGHVHGTLASFDAFHETELIAPACHDTASAIAGIPANLDDAAYICSGTWSLVGAHIPRPVTSDEAMRSRYTNQGAAAGGFCFHTNVNGMWLIKQCMDHWSALGRHFSIEDLVERATACDPCGVIDVDAAPLLLDTDMPSRINHELKQRRLEPIPDSPGNEPLFARLIFESLAARYATALAQLQQILDRRIESVHVLGGGNRNRLLLTLTAERTALPVETGHAESSTIGNFALQMAAGEVSGKPLTMDAVRHWATMFCKTCPD